MGVTRQTVYNWISKGLINVVKSPTGQNLITEEEYARLMNEKDRSS